VVISLSNLRFNNVRNAQCSQICKGDGGHVKGHCPLFFSSPNEDTSRSFKLTHTQYSIIHSSIPKYPNTLPHPLLRPPCPGHLRSSPQCRTTNTSTTHIAPQGSRQRAAIRSPYSEMSELFLILTIASLCGCLSWSRLSCCCRSSTCCCCSWTYLRGMKLCVDSLDWVLTVDGVWKLLVIVC
jgi:hypothetical protein